MNKMNIYKNGASMVALTKSGLTPFHHLQFHLKIYSANFQKPKKVTY
jgi:hypothetical protein